MVSSFPLPDIASLWQETAVERPVFDVLRADEAYDIAIIGGGFTGLSTARYLARRGLSSVVLEANRIGWGASGRNGGVISAKFRVSFAAIAARYGLDVARRMHHLGREAVEHVGELVEDYALTSAQYQPTGSLRCAHNAASLAALRQEAEWLSSAFGDSSCTILSTEQVAVETGSTDFVGAMLTIKGGIIHPLNFVLGLASGLKVQGITVYEQTPVQAFKHEEAGIRLQTPSGSIKARQVVIATNAYSDLTRAMPLVTRSLIPFRSAMIATEPLMGKLGESLLATGRSYTETRRMMRWFRKAGDRLLYGGRGAFGKSDSNSAFAALHKAMLRQFPQLDGIAITHQWSGLVAMTLDAIPHLGRLDERVVYAVGYNGSGVALASLMGKYIAAFIVGEQPDLGLLTSRQLKPIPFYPIREPAVRLVAGWYQFLDVIGR